MDELFLYLGIYIIVLFVMSWWIGRKETEEGFLIAERNRPWWQVACSKYAITIGAAWYVAYTAFAYEYGLNVLTLLIGLVFGYVFFAWWGAPRIKRYSEEGGGFYTMHEFVKKRTGSTHAEFLANGVVLLYVTMFLFVGVVAGGTLLESFGYVTYEQAVVLTLLVVTGYVLLAGFKAVILTDVLQGTIMLGLLLAIVYSFVGQSTYSFAEIAESRPIDALTVAMFGIFGLIATFAAPDRYQLSYAGKSKRTLQWGFAAAAVPVFLSAIALVGIGTVMYLVNPGLEGAEVFPTAMTQVLSPEFASLAIVMFFAGLMSSADTGLYVIASHSQVFFKRGINRYDMRRVILGVGVIGLVASYFMRDVVDLSILAAGISTALAFPMIYLVAGGTSARLFLNVLYGGALGVVAGVIVFGLDPKAAAFVLLGNVLGFVVYLITKKRKVS